MEEGKRSATDILLDLETRLITLEQRSKNIEFLLKTLLSKANQSIPPKANIQDIPFDTINKDNFDNRPKTNKFASIAASHGLNINDNSESFVVPSQDESSMTEAAARAPTRAQRGPKPNGKKASVSQIVNKDNNPLFLANIEIFDENNELISQTRTNPKGRWLLSLAPGDYQVHVTKRFPPESSKKPIDIMYKISIPPTDKPLELDPHNVVG